MKRKSPAYQRASAYLRECIDDSRAGPGTRLSTVAILARNAGVSPVTMLKAVQAFRRDGILSVSHGKGITIITAPHPEPATAESVCDAPGARQTHERVAAAVRTDLLNGAFLAGELLPKSKVLCSRYGVCNPTLHKALNSLADEGVLGRQTRQYRVPEYKSASGAGTLVLYAVGDEYGNIEFFSPRTREILRTLESECLRTGLHLEVVTYDFRNSRFRIPHPIEQSLRNLPGGPPVIGHIIWTTGIPFERVESQIETLSSSRKPVAIIDEGDGFVLRSPVSQRRPVAHFRMVDNFMAAVTMARFLIGLGHRRACYISCHHDGYWSQQRELGIRKVFTDSGIGDGLTVRSCPSTMSREESEQSERLKSDINDLLEKKLRVRGSPVWSLPHDYYSLNMDLNMFISAKFQRDHLGPLLEQAAQDTEATAWIAANDRIAFECLSFLEKRKIAVPRRISVVGFDDTIEAMFQGLTSFNFNETAAVKAAISFVVNPGTTYKQAGFRSGTHRIDGYLVERNSCSKTNKYGNG